MSQFRKSKNHSEFQPFPRPEKFLSASPCVSLGPRWVLKFLKSSPGQQWHRQHRSAFSFGVFLSIHWNIWPLWAYLSQGLLFISFLCLHALISEEKIIGSCQHGSRYCPPTILRDHLTLIASLLCGSQQPGSSLWMLISVFFNQHHFKLVASQPSKDCPGS